MGDTTIERTARKSREGGKLDVEDEEQRQARMREWTQAIRRRPNTDI